MLPLIVPRALIYLVEFEDLEEVRDRGWIEDELRGEGEVPIGKMGRLRFEPEGKKRLTYSVIPEGAFWGEISVMEMVLNKEGLVQAGYPGVMRAEEGYMDLMVRQFNAVADGFPVNISDNYPDLLGVLK